MGLVDRLLPGPSVYPAALEAAARYAEGPIVAIGAAKAAIDSGNGRPPGKVSTWSATSRANSSTPRTRRKACRHSSARAGHRSKVANATASSPAVSGLRATCDADPLCRTHPQRPLM